MYEKNKEIQLSFLTLDPIKYDYLTGKKDSYKTTLKAFLNLIKLKQMINVNFVINKINYKDLKFLFTFLSLFNYNLFLISSLDYRGEAYKNKDLLKIKYTKIRNEIYETIKIAKKMNNKKIKIHDIPLCIFRDNLDLIKDYHYDLITKNNRENRYNALHKIKLESCKECKYNQQCFGIFKSYLEIFGDEEFKPIK